MQLSTKTWGGNSKPGLFWIYPPTSMYHAHILTIYVQSVQKLSCVFGYFDVAKLLYLLLAQLISLFLSPVSIVVFCIYTSVMTSIETAEPFGLPISSSWLLVCSLFCLPPHQRSSLGPPQSQALQVFSSWLQSSCGNSVKTDSPCAVS